MMKMMDQDPKTPDPQPCHECGEVDCACEPRESRVSSGGQVIALCEWRRPVLVKDSKVEQRRG